MGLSLVLAAAAILLVFSVMMAAWLARQDARDPDSADFW
jgi:hypothetical protein